MSTIDDKLALANDNVPKVYAAGVKGGGATNLQNGESTGSLKSVLALDAVSEGAVALGTDTTAGLKCFNITAFDDANKTYTLDSVEGLEVGDVFSLEMTKDYDNVGQITAITDTKVTVDTYQGNDGGMHTLFRVPLKPTCGTVYCGENTFVAGKGTLAKGDNAVAMGLNTQAKGDNSVAEGEGSIASGKNAKASGINSQAISEGAVAFGKNSIAGSKCFNVLSFDDTNKSYTLDSVEGLAVGDVFSLKFNNIYDNKGSITAINGKVVTVDNYQPNETSAVKYFRVVSKPTCGTTDFGIAAFAEGEECMAVGDNSHASGARTLANGRYAFTEGIDTVAHSAAHAQGVECEARGYASHAQGQGTLATKPQSSAAGLRTQANGQASHADGMYGKANGKASRVSGYSCVADGDYSEAGGAMTQANGEHSRAGGYGCKANGKGAFAFGRYAAANGEYSFVRGKLNLVDSNNKYVEIVGNGDASKRSNAYTLDWNGNAWFAGNVEVGGTKIILKSNDSLGLRFEITVDNAGKLCVTPLKL